MLRPSPKALCTMLFTALVALLAAGPHVAQGRLSRRLPDEKPCGALCTARGAITRLSEFSVLPVAYAAEEDTVANVVEDAAEFVKETASQAADSAGEAAAAAGDVASDAAQAAKDKAGALNDMVRDAVYEFQKRQAAAAQKAKEAGAPEPEPATVADRAKEYYDHAYAAVQDVLKRMRKAAGVDGAEKKQEL